jgi:hypothetical protein
VCRYVSSGFKISPKSIFELLHTARWTARYDDTNMALLQLSVEALPQSGMFMLTLSILRMLLVETLVQMKGERTCHE